MKYIILLCIAAYLITLGYFFLVWRDLMREAKYINQQKIRLNEIQADKIKNRDKDWKELIKDAANQGKG